VARRNGNTTETDATTVVQFAEKPRTLAATLRALGLGNDAVREIATDDGTTDIRVTLGPDFQLPTQS
jgi:hypothetical protein